MNEAESVEGDPAGLLQRVPELAALAQRSSKLKHAIERGRPHAVYRALIGLKLRGAGSDAELVKALLARRRLFLQPLTSKPWLFTYNSVGATVYGSAELDPGDQTSIKTQYFVLGFLPVFPLGAFLTRPAGKGWTFFGRVPLSVRDYFWQRGMASAALLLVLGGALSAFLSARYNTVHLANALPFPVNVKIGSAEQVVKAGSVGSLRSVVGTQRVEVRSQGNLIDQDSIEVPRGYDAVVYNVLGAAGVYLETVVYSEKAADNSEQQGQLFCGHKSIAIDDVDYAFRDPPASLSMEKGSKPVAKKHMGVLTGEAAKCAQYLDKIGESGGAGELRQALARVHVPNE
jgi:hypothetical protein